MLNKARLQRLGQNEIDQDEDRLIDIVELIYRIWSRQDLHLVSAAIPWVIR